MSAVDGNMTSPVILDDDGTCKCCAVIVPSDEIIVCSCCKSRFHALCKKTTGKICTKSLLSAFMSATAKDNFMWYCDPCLVTFNIEKSKDETCRLTTLEKKFTSIESTLN